MRAARLLGTQRISYPGHRTAPRHIMEARRNSLSLFLHGRLAQKRGYAIMQQWTASDHWGSCGQSCCCCRAAVGEVYGSCQVCAAVGHILRDVDGAPDDGDFSGPPRSPPPLPGTSPPPPSALAEGPKEAPTTPTSADGTRTADSGALRRASAELLTPRQDAECA